eukprot:6191281-Pleurochrysis_carterae.AAC.1
MSGSVGLELALISYAIDDSYCCAVSCGSMHAQTIRYATTRIAAMRGWLPYPSLRCERRAVQHGGTSSIFT